MVQHEESALHKAIRRLIGSKMRFTPAPNGQTINVGGRDLTPEQVLELHAKGQLTSWGIAELARKHREE